LLAAALLLVALLIPPAAVAAPAAATTLSISGQATWISPGHVDVFITVQGTGGVGGVDVVVDQATPFGPASGGGGTPIFCDGQRHTYGVQISGGAFVLGEALATATGACPVSGAVAASNTIRLRKP
jgi:hypothetical protein